MITFMTLSFLSLSFLNLKYQDFNKISWNPKYIGTYCIQKIITCQLLLSFLSSPKYLVTVPWQVNPDRVSTATLSVAPLVNGATITIVVGKTEFKEYITPSIEQSIHVLRFKVIILYKYPYH